MNNVAISGIQLRNIYLDPALVTPFYIFSLSPFLSLLMNLCYVPVSGFRSWVRKHWGDKCFQVSSAFSAGQGEAFYRNSNIATVQLQYRRISTFNLNALFLSVLYQTYSASLKMKKKKTEQALHKPARLGFWWPEHHPTHQHQLCFSEVVAVAGLSGFNVWV